MGSLHRYINLLTENLVRLDRNDREHSEFREAIQRFDIMFRFVSLGFIVLATMMSIYQFLG